MGLDRIEKEEAATAEIARENRGLKRDIAKEQREAARRAAEEAAKHKNALALKKVDQQGDIEKLEITKQMEAAGADEKTRREVATKVEILKKGGYDDTFINGVLPELLGVGDYKRKTAPDEARRLLLTERVKDPSFSRKPAAEQQKIIDQDMETIYGAKPTTPAAPASPAAGGLPQPSPGGKKGTPFLTPDGKVVYR
jgi:hypothetical protein